MLPPGQEVPLNLVRLVEEETAEQQTEEKAQNADGTTADGGHDGEGKAAQAAGMSGDGSFQA